MKIAQDEIRKLVVQTLQEMIGSDLSGISDETKPIEAYGLDSHDGIDFATYLSARLTFEIPVSINPFIIDKPTGPVQRTVGGIIRLIAELSEREE